ncbi:hypothetical protein MASR1M90_17210 [Desulfovibrionales bacterium]
MPHHLQLVIKTDPSTLTSLSTLLQSGFLVSTDTDVPLTDLLVSLPGFTLSYLGDAVQTIFVNGVPLDDMQQRIQPGTTIALSAAMPGLAGAIFRKQGLHGSLRTKPVALSSADSSTSPVRIKLFNSIATDRAQDLFAQGVMIDAQAVLDLLQRRSDIFAQADLELDAQEKTSISDLKDQLANIPTAQVHVRVQSARA